MKRYLRMALLWAVLAVGVLFLAGCATAPAQVVSVPTPLPCPAAAQLPAEPARTIYLNPENPGQAVQAYAANRTRWIGYAGALREKLEACK